MVGRGIARFTDEKTEPQRGYPACPRRVVSDEQLNVKPGLTKTPADFYTQCLSLFIASPPAFLSHTELLNPFTCRVVGDDNKKFEQGRLK